MATYSFALVQIQNGQQVRNVLNYFSDNANILDLQDEVDAFRLIWTTSGWNSILNEDWQMTGADVRDLVAGGPVISYTFTAGPLVGDVIVGSTVATQTAFLLSTQAIATTLPNRGRIYLAGMDRTTIDPGGLYSSPVVVKGQALGDQLIAPVVAGGGVLTLRIVQLGIGGLFVKDNPVDNVVARNNPATQRRRRIGVGL